MVKSSSDDLHGTIGSYGELREALLNSTPQEYTREEIALTPENVVSLVEGFEGEVNNGGIDQFFFNSGGDYFRETVDALELIGAKKTAQILRDACSRFPGGEPPIGLHERREILLRSVSPDAEAFTDLDEQFYRYEDELYDLLERFRDRSELRV